MPWGVPFDPRLIGTKCAGPYTGVTRGWYTIRPQLVYCSLAARGVAVIRPHYQPDPLDRVYVDGAGEIETITIVRVELESIRARWARVPLRWVNGVPRGRGEEHERRFVAAGVGSSQRRATTWTATSTMRGNFPASTCHVSRCNIRLFSAPDTPLDTCPARGERIRSKRMSRYPHRPVRREHGAERWALPTVAEAPVGVSTEPVHDSSFGVQHGEGAFLIHPHNEADVASCRCR